jgi:site-specific DNA recombinase
MKLIGYVRVSSVGQEENSSLEDQQRRIQQYCDAMKHELVDVFVEVGSGKSTKTRPEFQNALQAVQDRADGIIAIKLDRITRNTRDVLQLVEEILEPYNKHLVLLDMNIDTSHPVGKMILTMMSAVAELERTNILERCSRGREFKKSKGLYVGGSPAFGMNVVVGQNQLEINAEEQEVIRIIRNARAHGMSLNAIAKDLNDREIPSKRGGRWYASSVRNVINRAPELAMFRNLE